MAREANPRIPVSPTGPNGSERTCAYGLRPASQHKRQAYVAENALYFPLGASDVFSSTGPLVPFAILPLESFMPP